MGLPIQQECSICSDMQTGADALLKRRSHNGQNSEDTGRFKVYPRDTILGVNMSCQRNFHILLPVPFPSDAKTRLVHPSPFALL